MFGAIVLFLTAVLAAGFLAWRTDRGGWAGLLIGLVTELAIWVVWQDMGGAGEVLALVGGAVVAAIAAIGLPTVDALAAMFLAAALAYAMVWVVPSGPDSPFGVLVAAPAAGFVVGAVLALAKAGLRRSRLRKTNVG